MVCSECDVAVICIILMVAYHNFEHESAHFLNIFLTTMMVRR